MANSKQKALDALNKLNNYSKLSANHRWVSTVRHYIKDDSRINTGMVQLLAVEHELSQWPVLSQYMIERIVHRLQHHI